MDNKEIGTKRLADEISGGCRHKKLSEEFEKKLSELSKIHDAIKEEIKNQLENQGFKCNEEVDLEVDINDSKLRGRADIACREPIELIIEVKSSKIGRGRIADIYQALIYGYMWKRKYGKEPQIMLVYSNYSITSNTVVVVDLGSSIRLKVPGRYFYIKLNIKLNLVEGLANELSKSGYVLSRDCEYCVNENCPLNKVKLTQ